MGYIYLYFDKDPVRWDEKLKDQANDSLSFLYGSWRFV